MPRLKSMKRRGSSSRCPATCTCTCRTQTLVTQRPSALGPLRLRLRQLRITASVQRQLKTRSATPGFWPPISATLRFKFPKSDVSAGPVARASSYRLEDQMQRHLNDAWTANRVLNEARPRRTLSGANRSRVGHRRNRSEPLAIECAWSSLHVRAVTGIQGDVVVRRVKTGVVKNVEELRIVAQ